MTTSSSERQIRTYGGWRRARGMGLFGLGPAGTAAVPGCVMVPLCAAAASPALGAALALPAAVVALLTLLRVNDASVAALLARRFCWSWVVATGRTSFRGQLQHGGGWSLPPALSSMELLSVEEGRFGLVWDLRTGRLTATLRCAAASTWLVDPDDADTWVLMWHAWLASLGYLPMVHAVAVTVDTAPEPGTTLEDAVIPRIEADAPADVRHLMRELVRRSPATSAGIETLVSITFDPATASPRLRSVPEIVSEIDRRITGLETSLTSCGLAVLGRATAEELAGIVRSAFDPSARGDVDRLIPAAAEDATVAPPAWRDAGPVAAEEHWDRYMHDSGTSVSWAWSEPPTQPVSSGILSRLLSPGRFPRRVTLRYRTLPAGQSARLLESEVNAAAFRDAYRRAQKRDESARDVADRLRAQRAAAEEAQGAGVVHISLYATTTVTDPADLPAAITDVESRADQSKIRLRQLYGAQAAGFVATLPLGRIP
jgi:hypothetical protein